MKKRKIIVMLLCMVTLFVVSVNTVEASASKKGMKFLKGAWLTAGNSQAEKVIFTKKYMKIYSLWNENHTRIKSPKAKGKFMYKSRIIYTKKKGKEWVVKVGQKGHYTYYKGYGKGLECWWKDKNEWLYSASDSLMKVE